MRERIQEPDQLSQGQALRVILRAMRFVGPFKWRFTVKAALLLVSFVPLLIIPWPLKLIIDHVIEGVPVTDPVRPYPPAVSRIMDSLADFTTTELLFLIIGFQIVLFVLAGAFGTAGGERDSADARLANGFDTATRTENEANLGWSFAGGLLGLFDFRWTLGLTQSINHHYRRQLFERIQALPMTSFEDARIGDAVYRVMYDTPAITNACYRILLTPIAAPLGIALAAWIMGYAYGDIPILQWSALAFIPLALLASWPLAGVMRRLSGESRRAGATTTSTAEEGISNILAVQSQGGEGRQRSRFDSDSWGAFGRFRAILLLGMGAFFVGAIPGVALLGYVFLDVTDKVILGELSRGDFVLLFGYYLRITSAAVDLGGLWFSVQDSAAGLNRVFYLMDLPAERDTPDARPLPPAARHLQFEDVDYSYPDGTPALVGATAEAKVGEVLALVGPAGAGKTTLAYLVPRFLQPTRGRVTIDGHDVADATVESLRAQIAFVFQETVLFDATVEENIRVGKPDASEAEVWRAARLAGAADFIRALPQGMQTPLGRAGGKLSVGQKQRLSIARALVRDARILILDEPTSALDPDTERVLVQTLREASRDRVVIVIAHRLSTVREADQILFLDAGQIIERGSHAELMARPDGAFRRFVDLQTRGAA